MAEEIRQDGKVILSSPDRRTISMIYNNLTGKNFSGQKYRDYIAYVAFEDMGFRPGTITYTRDGIPIKEDVIPAENS